MERILGRIKRATRRFDGRRAAAKLMTVVLVASSLLSSLSPAVAYAAEPSRESDTCYVKTSSQAEGALYGGIQGVRTRKYTVTHDGQSNVGFCIEPHKKSPASGTYVTEGVDDENLRTVLWFGAKGPGFDASMWPSTDFEGNPFDADDYYSTTHVLLGYLFTGNRDDTFHLCTSQYISWFESKIINGTLQTMKSRKDEVPGQESFHVFKVLSSSGSTEQDTQYLISWNYFTGNLALKKTSANTSLTNGNDCYSLAGAEFSVTDSKGKTVGTLTTDANGDTNTLRAIPAGTYTIHETKAPKGYYTAADQTVTVSNGRTTTVNVSDPPANDPMQMLVGKYDGEKKYNGAGNLPQGSASLAGAEFTVEYYDTLGYGDYDALKAADAQPTRKWVLRTNSNGVSLFTDSYLVSGDAFYRTTNGTPTLPRGTVVVYESKAPEGYKLNGEVSFQKIQENPAQGVITYNAPEVAEQVYRGDFHFTKKAENGSDRLAGVPFKVTSLTTGESHIAVTDENGYFSSASSWNAHDANTNANDWALSADGTIDSSKLDATAGLWFGKNTVKNADGTTTDGKAIPADNSRGAMPYDTYSVQELRCTANEGYALVDTTVTISRDGATVDFGTLDDPEPEIHTTALDASDSDHYVGVGSVKVSDRVEYSHLVAGKTYTVTGELHDAETGDAIKVGGKAVTASQTFTAEKSHGSVNVDFTFDSYDLAGKTLVVYETLTDEGGSKLAEHKDKGDVSQQVEVVKPTVGTTAKDGVDGDKNVVPDDTATVVDTVSYANLIPGKEYTLTGTLHVKKTDKDGKVTEETLTDADGNPVTATQTFTPEKADGTVDVTFTFDALKLKKDTQLVAFESLTLDGHEVASHADIDDDGQTVTIVPPTVGTTAKDGHDGDKNVVSDAETTVVDSVDYKGLVPGKEYTVTGTLHVKKTDKDGKVTEETVTDKDGKAVTAKTTFTPDKADGSVDVTFTFDGSAIPDGSEVVAFESLARNDVELAAHADIKDENQTVTFHEPAVGTTATDKLDGDKNVVADAETTVTDTIAYNGVLSGTDYTMAGILMDAETGLPVLTGEGAKKYSEDDLKKFTSGLMEVLGFQSTTYSIKVKGEDWGSGADIVRNADGSYTYDASKRTENADGTWTGKTDTQTLTQQEDGTWRLTGWTGEGKGSATTAVDGIRTVNETLSADEVEVSDNGIDWSNTEKLPTATIDVAKVRAYAEENKDLLSCLVYKTAEFTPEAESGTIDMDYSFDSDDVIDRLSGETKDLVVFEVMFKGSIDNASDENPVSIVASECDKDNEGQTVKLVPSTVGTTATDKSDGDHELMEGKDATVTDKVTYKNLIPGKEYVLKATLMDKATGEPLSVGDKHVTAELRFTPNSPDGSVDIDLGPFDASQLGGHELVVYEELYKQVEVNGEVTDVLVAEHKDLDDKDQTVTVTDSPSGETPGGKYGKTGGDMTGMAVAIGVLLAAAGGTAAYGLKKRRDAKGGADDGPKNDSEA